METFILSLIQGLTEFLPVSSSGHLLLAESFGVSDQTMNFDAALHLGTLIAVLLYFFKDVLDMLFGLWKKGVAQTLAFQLFVATIPILIVGYFAKDVIETTFRSPMIVGWAAIFYGILLWIVDKYAKKDRTIRRMTYKDAFIIGCAQVLSLVPGTSRSGITITAARALGIKRTESTRFSMLLSIPTIAVAGAYAFWLAIHQTASDQSNQLGWGIVLSAVFGLAAIWFLMKWVGHASFGIFAAYRVALGVFILLWFM